MGLFNLFKKRKPKTEDEIRKFFYGLMDKYFEGSSEKLNSDAKKLLELSQYDISVSELSTIFLRSVAFLGNKSGWNSKVLKSLKNDCSSKLPEAELKWIYCYCDAHYVNKNSDNELALLMELGGRQMGLPSPLGYVSTNYKFK